MLSVGDIIRKSQPSLFWCMRGLKRAQREALYTLFAFCRHIDGVARSDMPKAEKIELLNAWKEELDNIYDKKVPQTNIGRKIYKNCMRFDLPKMMWQEMLSSAYLNGPSPLQAPTREVFEEYMNGTAVVPLNLALRIIGGCHQSANNELAKRLGRAIMITYILRDVKDDAKHEHLYLTADMLTEAGIDIEAPRQVVENRNLTLVRQKLAQDVEKDFLNAGRLLNRMNKKTTMPLRLIKNIGERQFEMMKNRGWDIISPKPKLSAVDQAKIAYKTIFK